MTPVSNNTVTFKFIATSPPDTAQFAVRLQYSN